MYLKNKHFIDLFNSQQLADRDLALYKQERLSAKAYMFTSNCNRYIEIYYVDTKVFSSFDKKATLDNGGWESMTTKKWMNYGFSLIGSRVFLMQKNFEWLLKSICHNIKPVPYKNDVIINC